jgi:cytosine/adenosine deaminase-related metal-dependent hydrolase
MKKRPALRLVRGLSLPCLLALTSLLPDPAAAQAPAPRFEASPAQSLVLEDARWFDGQDFRDGRLLVHEGRFVASLPAGTPARTESLRGRFLVSPLGEAHNHNLQNAWGFERFAPRYIADGVFYAAMLCGDPPGVAPLRERAGQAHTPDVVYVTSCITSSDGHPLGMMLNDTAPGAPRLSFEDVADKAVLVMDNPDEVRRKWPLVAQRGGGLIKLIMSYHERPELRQDPAKRGSLGVSAEVAATVVELAHRDGLRVSAHVDSAADFAAALRAGVDQIAHLPGYFFHHQTPADAYRLTPELAREAARRGVEVISTTAASRLFPAEPALREAIEALQRRNLQTLREAGVRVLLGSDLFMGTGLSEYRQLQALGVYEPAELLRLATITTPRALFPQRRLGCFEPGCEASFLVLESNPLETPQALDRPLARYKQGQALRAVAAP